MLKLVQHDVFIHNWCKLRYNSQQNIHAKIITMSGDYKKLLNKSKKKKFADPKNMGVNIDKNEYYEIILSNSAHPEKMK